MERLFLLQLAGMSGTGKSTLAREIARRTGAVVVDVDVLKSAALEVGAQAIKQAELTGVFNGGELRPD